jgi:hypothetical protein
VEVVLIHKTVGVLPPDMMKTGVEMGKKMVAKPGEFVPKGKLKSTLAALNNWMIICFWDVPSLDVLMPAVEQMKMVGWNTDIIPVETAEVWLSKLEKAQAKR